MKHILSNKKNNYLRKFRFFDYFFAILLLCSVLVFLLWFSRSKQTVVIELEAVFDNHTHTIPVDNRIAQAVNIGVVGYDEFGNRVAKVVDAFKTDYGGSYSYVRAAIELEVLEEKKTGLYKYKNQRLRVGDTINLTLNNTSFNGKILHIFQSRENYFQHQRQSLKRFVVTLSLENVYSWLVDTYTQDFVVYDNQNRTVFKVLAVKRKKSDSLLTLEKNGSLRSRDSLQYENVEMTASVLAFCDEVCYFNYFQPMKVGQRLWTQNEKSFISEAVIMKIIEEEDDQ